MSKLETIDIRVALGDVVRILKAGRLATGLLVGALG